jgi:hypothetical protein
VEPTPTSEPIPEHHRVQAVRLAYANQAVLSYAFYTLGAAIAFVAVALSLSETAAGLHATLMAVGVISTGVLGERLDHAIGVTATQRAGLAVLAVGLLLLAWAPALEITLLAALATGLGAGTIFGHANRALGTGGVAAGRLQFMRAAVAAKAAQLLVPLTISLGVALALGWQLVVVPVLIAIVVLLVASRLDAGSVLGGVRAAGRLSLAYWLPWMLTVSAVSLEFLVIVWGAPLVADRSGASLSDATLTISAFILGMLLGRVVLSFDGFRLPQPATLIRLGLALSITAGLVLWVSTSVWLSAGAMFVAGAGIGLLYPVTAALTLAAAPERPDAAAARLVAAPGSAMLLAPLIVGIMADLVGISAAWLLMPALCVATFALSVPVTRAYRAAEAGAAA